MRFIVMFVTAVCVLFLIKPKLFTANVECNGTVIKLPKTEKPIRFLNFKFSLNGGDLVFWFTFNLAVDFELKWH